MSVTSRTAGNPTPGALRIYAHAARAELAAAKVDLVAAQTLLQSSRIDKPRRFDTLFDAANTRFSSALEHEQNAGDMFDRLGLRTEALELHNGIGDLYSYDDPTATRADRRSFGLGTVADAMPTVVRGQRLLKYFPG